MNPLEILELLKLLPMLQQSFATISYSISSSYFSLDPLLNHKIFKSKRPVRRGRQMEERINVKKKLLGATLLLGVVTTCSILLITSPEIFLVALMINMAFSVLALNTIRLQERKPYAAQKKHLVSKLDTIFKGKLSPKLKKKIAKKLILNKPLRFEETFFANDTEKKLFQDKETKLLQLQRHLSDSAPILKARESYFKSSDLKIRSYTSLTKLGILMIAGAILFTAPMSLASISAIITITFIVLTTISFFGNVARFNKASTALKKSKGKRLSFREKFRNFSKTWRHIEKKLGLSNQNMQSNKLESYDLASQYMIAAIFQVGLLALGTAITLLVLNIPVFSMLAGAVLITGICMSLLKTMKSSQDKDIKQLELELLELNKENHPSTNLKRQIKKLKIEDLKNHNPYKIQFNLVKCTLITIISIPVTLMKLSICALLFLSKLVQEDSPEQSETERKTHNPFKWDTIQLDFVSIWTKNSPTLNCASEDNTKQINELIKAKIHLEDPTHSDKKLSKIITAQDIIEIEKNITAFHQDIELLKTNLKPNKKIFPLKLIIMIIILPILLITTTLSLCLWSLTEAAPLILKYIDKGLSNLVHVRKEGRSPKMRFLLGGLLPLTVPLFILSKVLTHEATKTFMSILTFPLRIIGKLLLNFNEKIKRTSGSLLTDTKKSDQIKDITSNIKRKGFKLNATKNLGTIELDALLSKYDPNTREEKLKQITHQYKLDQVRKKIHGKFKIKNHSVFSNEVRHLFEDSPSPRFETQTPFSADKNIIENPLNKRMIQQRRNSPDSIRDLIDNNMSPTKISMDEPQNDTLNITEPRSSTTKKSGM